MGTAYHFNQARLNIQGGDVSAHADCKRGHCVRQCREPVPFRETAMGASEEVANLTQPEHDERRSKAILTAIGEHHRQRTEVRV